MSRFRADPRISAALLPIVAASLPAVATALAPVFPGRRQLASRMFGIELWFEY